MDRGDDLRVVDTALTRIGRVANSRRSAAVRAERAGVDLGATAIATLAAVHHHGPARLTTIAEQVDLEPSRISREIRRLVEAGLVEQRPDPTDRRATQLRCTRRGHASFRRYRAVADAMLADTLAGWSDGDVRTLACLLERLAEGL